MQSQNRAADRRLDTDDENARSCARDLMTTTSKINFKPDKKEMMEEEHRTV